MTQNNRDSVSGEGFLKVLIASARTPGFWSFVAAIVGVVAIVGGGIFYVTIEEIRDFSISVTIIGAVLLLIALILSPRAIAIFLMGRQGRFGANVVVMTVAFFIIVILVNFLVFRTANRFDVTATRVLTLSPQTVQILNSLETTVRANAFFTPGAQTRQQVEDLLNEFERNSGGNFDYRFLDPELQKSIADRYNVTNFPVIVFEDMSEGRLQQVSTFQEQDFVTGVLVATGVDQKRVYFLTGHNEASITRDRVTGNTDQEGLDLALEGIRNDNYRVLPLNLKQDGSVPEDAAMLLIAGPKSDLDQDEFLALNNYIKGGGRVLALLDPGSPNTFANLFFQWGVVVEEDSIADLISNVSEQALTPLIQRANSQFPPSSVNGVSITEQLDSAFFPGVTAVEPFRAPEDQPPFIDFIPLAASTPGSWLESDTEDVNFTPTEDLRGPFFVASLVVATGTIDESQFHEQAKMVIFGDSDFARNRFFASVNNADFLLNSVNWLADDYELISIRPKLVPYRELVVTSRERDFMKWSSWFIPPAVMLLIGAVVWWRRR
jgi:ABC-type uncharacterized transport system involved in gliding motility auxiliary subunit